MVLVDQSHQLLETVLGLKSLLFGLSVLLSLFTVDLQLGLVAILHLVLFDFGCDKVSLHPCDHVLVRSLVHEMDVVSLLNTLQGVLSV